MKSVRPRTRTKLFLAVAVLLLAAVSIVVALRVSPMQQAQVAGQTVQVGAAPSLSISGPGELDLFGQRLPTKIRFVGPVRPRLTLSHITLGQQLSSIVSSHNHGNVRANIGQELASAWTRYFGWEMAITGGCALLLAGALAGWARLPARHTVVLLAASLVFTEAVNAGGIMVTAYTAPARLRQVTSLDALAGRSSLPPVPRAPGKPRPHVQAVVMGDSTAAGVGNPPKAHPSRLDKACQRSSETYARYLAMINGWRVLNLACSSATIHAGILGPQDRGAVTVPAQLAEAKKATHASVVIVSIGADDLRWSALLQLCTVTPTCDSKASLAYFQQRLAAFTVRYYQLLKQLAALPGHPTVLVNLYYDPFDPSKHCLDGVGLTAAKQNSLTALLDALNKVLASGAQVSGLIPVTPDFSGHALCDPSPYVQGVHDPAPFHPTASGELAIAVADAQALQQHAAPSPSAGTP